MRTAKKIMAFILVAMLLTQFIAVLPVLAAEYPPQPAPEKLRVEAIKDTPPDIEPPIGYNEVDKYYVDLKTDGLAAPPGVPDPSIYLNYYLQEVNKPYKPAKPVVQKEGNIPADTTGVNEIRLKELSSGTVYYAYAKAYYRCTVDSTTYTSPESNPSNTVKFLTDIDIAAYSHGPNQIKIVWDDVWNSGKRMNYRLYISENEDFANTPPIYIGPEQIGPNGPVTVNEAEGKLEYIHTVRDPGRVYYIKVAPDTAETELKRSESSRTVAVSSYILAKTTKMSVTDAGTVWKLEWTPVVTGLADSDIKVTYQIYRSAGSDSSIEQYMASIDDTTFFLTLQPGEEEYYYIIKAIVTKNGQDLYPGITIQSQRIYVVESEVPYTPSTPELVSEFSNAGETIISYEGELKPDSATILWKAPLKGNGDIDADVEYDIWLIPDPNMLDDPPSGTKIASSVKMNESNYVMNGTKLLGYKYKISGLTPNSTYYFKIVAKKNFIDFVDEQLANITLQSGPAVKIIITPAAGPVDQPVVPARPPLALKKDSQGKDMVTTSSAVITLMNKWYEEYVTLADGKFGWVYRTPQDIGPDIVQAIEDGTADPLKFRKVEYDAGVTIDVGCIPYSPDIDYNTLENITADKIVGFPAIPNDPDEDINDENAVPDGKKHNINITISGLEPNKTYIVWVRAARLDANLVSGPSDPIVITTAPDLPATAEKPTVPVFNYHYASDTFIDLGWNFDSRYVYNLRYGTSDNIEEASGNAVITPKDLEFTTFYRVKSLEPDTVYYFWIQAETTNEAGEKRQSDFSDSYMVKTQKLAPPETPKGFGVKGTKDAVTRNSITYEWIAEEGMEYILEIDDGIDYKDSIKYNIKNASEFTVGNLRSNFRYYARLYAYDPAKKLASEPTQSVTVRTLRSSDDYDSGEDTEDVIGGDFIDKDSISVDGIWTVRITGGDADRFIRHVQTDRMLDYILDLKTMPAGTKEISVIISQRVFRALGMLGENLVIKTQRNALIIRPGVLADKNGVYGSAAGEANFIIGITLESSTEGSNTKNLAFKTPVSGLEIRLSDGIEKPVGKLEKPLKIVYEYTPASWFKTGTTFGYVLPAGATEWEKKTATGNFDPDANLGTLSFETNVTGLVAVADQGKDFYDDISGSYARASIANVVSVHKLKSIQGRKFEPEKYLTIGDGVKFMLDMLDADYGNNYMSLAVRSGIIRSSDSNNPSAVCTREKLVAMAMRVYEIKTSQKAVATVDETGIYKDIGQTDPALLPKIRFAQEIGVIIRRFSDTFGPKDPVTRAESMVLLEKLLKYAGEL